MTQEMLVKQPVRTVGGHLKNMFTRKQFMAEAGNFAEISCVDFQFGYDMQFAFDEELGIHLELKDGKKLSLNQDAMKSLTNEINMSTKYLHSTPADLIVPHLNHHYRKKRDGMEARLFCEKSRVAALSLRPRLKFISLPSVLNAFDEVIGKDNIVGYHKPRFSWTAVVINIVLNEEFQVIDNDPVNIGLRYVHSFIDLKQGSLSAYTFRQWCANGACSEDRLSAWKFGKDDEGSFRKWVPSVVVEARAALSNEQKRLQRLVDIPTGSETSEILDHILEDRNVPSNVRDEVRTVVIDNRVDNLYGIYNALTEVSTHSELGEDHPRAIAQLEKAASGLAFHSELCPVCHHKK